MPVLPRSPLTGNEFFSLEGLLECAETKMGFFQKRPLQKSEGDLPEHISRWIFWGGLLNGIFGAFSRDDQKINANFFWTKFFKNHSGHGRPRRKSWTSAPKSAFSCSPGEGEKLFDPGASGHKGQECPREIRTKKFMFMLFFFPEHCGRVRKQPSKQPTEFPTSPPLMAIPDLPGTLPRSRFNGPLSLLSLA